MKADENRPDITTHPDVEDPYHGYSLDISCVDGDKVSVYAMIYNEVGGMQELPGSPVILKGNLPIGYLDIVNATSVRGWAYDKDSGTNPIDVHIYDGSSIIGAVTANNSRGDLTPVIGDPNHGFDYKLPQLSSGEHTIHAYAINCPVGTNPELLGSPKTIIVASKPILVERESTPHEGYFCSAIVENKIWTGTYSASDTSRLYSYFPEKVLADLETGESIYIIYPCSDGTVLIGCENGQLYFYNGSDFKEVLNELAGSYAIIEDINTGYAYSAHTRNKEPGVCEIYRSNNKINWSKTWSKSYCQIKAGIIYHGVPQFFGYNFHTKYGFRLFTVDSGDNWIYQNLQPRTRYLDAISDSNNHDICWLATSYSSGDAYGGHGPAGVSRLTRNGISKVLTTDGLVGKTIQRSPIDGYLYFSELFWKSRKAKAQIWRSKTGIKNTWELVITTTEPEIITQIFLDGRHYWFTKNHASHGKLFELIWT